MLVFLPDAPDSDAIVLDIRLHQSPSLQHRLELMFPDAGYPDEIVLKKPWQHEV